MSRRAVSPAVGTALLVAVTVIAAVAVGAAVPTLSDPPPRAGITLSVDGQQVALTHVSGDALAVADLRVRVWVAGEPLAHQPPVPFFAAQGFVSGPQGPFNSAEDGRWSPGERATFTIAATNDPVPSEDEAVRVRVTVDGAVVADLAGEA